MVQDPLLQILIVEDDPLVQDIVREALEDGGFQTQIVASGEAALALLNSGATNYRALLTDVHLTGTVTGWDVAKRAREINPEIPIVYMTGDAADDWPSHGVPKSMLLNKPFAPAQAVTAVSQLLNRAPGPSPE
ncbi:response regulator [Bradyrhizobium tropiciagri]|uniref:response regulator n=1 Tax=Bradyrhizobium tropiciagri TaxID=312253 RepID=UPI001BA8C908|nr:response regulator [Bradyrhizobium tropiciagri]